MHSAIFVVSVRQRVVQDWEKFLDEIGPRLKSEKGAIRLGENVWLVDCQQSVRALAWLVASADRLALPYAILQIEGAPRWLLGGFDPTSS